MLLVSKKKIRGNHTFQLQSGKERHTLLCILNLSANYLRKVRGYPQFSFWISRTLVKICFSRIFSKPHKNTFELVGTVLKNSLFAHQLTHTQTCICKLEVLFCRIIAFQSAIVQKKIKAKSRKCWRLEWTITSPLIPQKCGISSSMYFS